MKLTKSLKSIFWDTAAKDIDPKKHKNFIITRVAEKGGLADILWLKKKFGVPVIRRVVAHSRNVSAKTRNFWSIF